MSASSDSARSAATESARRPATTERRNDLAQRLIAAAQTAIAAHGLAGVRARALADEAGCSVGAIYGVFDDLDLLVLTVNALTLGEIDDALCAAVEGGTAADQLMRMADAYLDYAAANRPRWEALFQHRSAEGRPARPWFAEAQAAAFARVEAPLGALRPDLGDADRALLARTLFSAVHGMVALGLDAQVAAIGLSDLREQVRVVVRAIATGLTVPPAIA